MADGESTGVTTFLFSDVEGSTRQWEANPDDMNLALERHDAIVRSILRRYGGEIFSIAGDAFGAAFAQLDDACDAAIAIQRELKAEPWPAATPINVRLGFHMGVAQVRNANYFGPAVNRAARIMSAASGGQTVVSDRVAELIKNDHQLVDLGLQHLKDLAEPEHIWQLGLGNHPALRSARTVSDVRLPEPSTSLIGRDEDQAAVAALLTGNRVVAIVGPGGIGKTRLAVAVASQLVPDFDDGIVFADLSEVGSDAGVADAVAVAVGVRQGSDRSISETLVDWYRDDQALLVLDNCEPVLDGVAQLVELLVRECPNLGVLATSRHRIQAAHTAIYVLDEVAPSGARQLLVERIQALDPAFDPSAHEDDIEALVARLDGVPLAVELAAARCRGLTPGQLLERLAAGHGALADPARTGRHQSVEAAILGSIQALPAAGQQLFSRCSVFRGEFELEAAEMVIGRDRIGRFATADALMELVDASLLQRLASGQFRMLAPLRETASALLGEADPVHDAHTRYYRDLAVRIGAGVAGADEAIWAEQARAEFPNLRVAWERSVAAGDFDAAADIVFGLWRHAFDQMQFELLRWAEATLEAGADTASTRANAACLATATACYLHLSCFDDLHGSVERLKSMGREVEPYLAVAMSMQAVALANQDRGEEAFAVAQQMRVVAMSVGDRWLEAMSFVFVRDFDQAVGRCRRLLNPTLWSWFHLFRGFSRTGEGRLAAAEDDFSQGEAFARRVGNTQALGVARNELGIVAAGADDRSLAATFGPLDQAIEIFQRLRTPLQLWNSLEVLAQAFARRGYLASAVRIWAAIDAEGVQPASIEQRVPIDPAQRMALADESEAGAVLDIWRAADFARAAIDTVLADVAREPRAAS